MPDGRGARATPTRARPVGLSPRDPLRPPPGRRDACPTTDPVTAVPVGAGRSAGGSRTACVPHPSGRGAHPSPRRTRASALHPRSTAPALRAVRLRAKLTLRSPPRAPTTSRSGICRQRQGCGNRPLSSPRPPSSPGWGPDALWKAGHRHPPSAFPQGLENPSGVSHSSPATTTSDITTHPLTSY